MQPRWALARKLPRELLLGVSSRGTRNLLEIVRLYDWTIGRGRGPREKGGWRETRLRLAEWAKSPTVLHRGGGAKSHAFISTKDELH